MLLFRCYFVVLVFGKGTFFRSSFSQVPGILGLVVFSVSVLLVFVFLLVWCLEGSDVFLSNSLRHLGIVFLHCSVLMLFLLLHVLAACFSMWVLGLPFYGNPLGGRLGMATTERPIYVCHLFLTIGVFGLNRRWPPGRGFSCCFVASK